MTGEEIRARLTAFAAGWSLYTGPERSEAQTFLNDLLACYGTSRREIGARFESRQETRFLDLLWPGVCIIEMKAPAEAERLSRHRRQALDYWRGSSDAEHGQAAPPYVVLCGFHRFEVWEPGRFPSEPRATFELRELPDRYDTMLFLAGAEPVFVGGHAAVTRDAARMVTGLSRQLADRRCGGPDERRDFILQAVWSMLAEDLGQLPGHRFTRIVEELIANPQRSSADELGRLFEILNDPAAQRPQHGLYASVPYANGGLFERPARLHLEPHELLVLREASAFNWRAVEPQIFGSCWRARSVMTSSGSWVRTTRTTRRCRRSSSPRSCGRGWSASRTSRSHARPHRAGRAHELRRTRPGIGSGNFLYLAYRELRRIERRLHEREAELRFAERACRCAASERSFFPLQEHPRNRARIPFAAALARVTLWMGHRLAS